MLNLSDFKTIPFKASYKADNGQIIKGVIRNRDTKSFFDGEGDRVFFEPDYIDHYIAPWWIPLKKLSRVDDTIRVLAVRQPWASLIVEGFKELEVRTYKTALKHHEKIAIYA